MRLIVDGYCNVLFSVSVDFPTLARSGRAFGTKCIPFFLPSFIHSRELWRNGSARPILRIHSFIHSCAALRVRVWHGQAKRAGRCCRSIEMVATPTSAQALACNAIVRYTPTRLSSLGLPHEGKARRGCEIRRIAVSSSWSLARRQRSLLHPSVSARPEFDFKPGLVLFLFVCLLGSGLGKAGKGRGKLPFAI